jgi:nicotinamidase-related amidase
MYDTVIFEGDGKTYTKMDQTLWPRHCVQESWGAELHKDLKVRRVHIGQFTAQ